MTDRLQRWVKILSIYFTAQALTQLAGLSAGLVLVNVLPVREFALYTLALSVVTFFNFASDLGSTGSLVFFFHDTTKKGEEFRPYLDAVLSLRRWAFTMGVLAVAVALPRAALAKGFGLRESLLATAAVTLAVWFQIEASLRVLALRLAERYGVSYRAELTGGTVRLILALVLAAASLLKAWVAVTSNALGAAAVGWVARRGEPPASQAHSAVPLGWFRRRVIRYLLPSLPSALYFSVQGPITVWLSATFGSTRNIAEVGALGRLGLAMGIFSGLTSVVFIPRLARITDDRIYLHRYLQFGALLVALGAAMVTAAAVVPEAFLFLLGKRYTGLERELLLVVSGAGLNLLGGYAVSVNLSRSWNRLEGAAVAALIVVQALLVALLPLGTTAGVLRFNLGTAVAGLSLQLLISWAGFTRPDWVRWM